MLILTPRTFYFRNDPQRLLEDWVDSESSTSMDDMHRHLAIYLGEDYTANQRGIDRLHNLYGWACLFLGLEVIFLVVLTAAEAKLR